MPFRRAALQIRRTLHGSSANDYDTYVDTSDRSRRDICFSFICDPPRVAWFMVGFVVSAFLFFMRSNGFDSISWLEVFIPLIMGSIVYMMFPFMLLCMMIGACSYRATSYCVNKIRESCCCKKPKLRKASVLPVCIVNANNNNNSPPTTPPPRPLNRARSQSLPA